MPGKFICKVIPFTKLLRVFFAMSFPAPFYYTSLTFLVSYDTKNNLAMDHTPKIFIPGFDVNKIWVGKSLRRRL